MFFFQNVAASATPILQPGPPDPQGAYFNGVDAYLARTSPTPMNLSYSPEMLSFWVSRDVGATYGMHIELNDGHTSNQSSWKQRVWYIYYGGRMDFGWWWDSVSQWEWKLNVPDVTGKMDHIVVNRSTGAEEVYVNGVYIGIMPNTYSVFGTQNFTTNWLEIGRAIQYNYGERFSQGHVKNVVFRHTQATAQEALDLYNIGIDGDPNTVFGSGIEGWYPFQTDFNDYSGNNYHFTNPNGSVVIV